MATSAAARRAGRAAGRGALRPAPPSSWRRSGSRGRRRVGTAITKRTPRARRRATRRARRIHRRELARRIGPTTATRSASRCVESSARRARPPLIEQDREQLPDLVEQRLGPSVVAARVGHRSWSAARLEAGRCGDAAPAARPKPLARGSGRPRSGSCRDDRGACGGAPRPRARVARGDPVRRAGCWRRGPSSSSYRWPSRPARQILGRGSLDRVNLAPAFHSVGSGFRQVPLRECSRLLSFKSKARNGRSPGLQPTEVRRGSSMRDSREIQVLVVDDDLALCELLRTTFELEGIKILEAHHVIEAERLLIGDPPGRDRARHRPARRRRDLLPRAAAREPADEDDADRRDQRLAGGRRARGRRRRERVRRQAVRPDQPARDPRAARRRLAVADRARSERPGWRGRRRAPPADPDRAAPARPACSTPTGRRSRRSSTRSRRATSAPARTHIASLRTRRG